MRIEPVHSNSRRVEPIDRQSRQDQRRKDEERSERQQQEEAYILNLSRGKVGTDSPFVSGAYTRAGYVAASERKSSPLPIDVPSKGSETEERGSRLDTYS